MFVNILFIPNIFFFFIPFCNNVQLWENVKNRDVPFRPSFSFLFFFFKSEQRGEKFNLSASILKYRVICQRLAYIWKDFYHLSREKFWREFEKGHFLQKRRKFIVLEIIENYWFKSYFFHCKTNLKFIVSVREVSIHQANIEKRMDIFFSPHLFWYWHNDIEINYCY